MNKLILTMGIISPMLFSSVVSAELLSNYIADTIPVPESAPTVASVPVVSDIDGLDFYADRSAFEGVCPDEIGVTVTEDFDTTLAPPSAVLGTAFPKPLDASSDNVAYTPGAIELGIEVSTPGGISDIELAAVGPGVTGVETFSVYSNLNTDTLNVSFPVEDGVTCVGMDLGSLASASTLDLSIHVGGVSYGPTQSSADTLASTFWGVVSTIGAITKIDISSAAGYNEGIDNVTFGANAPVDTTPPVITLLGDNPMNLAVGDAFIDPGATAYDDVDGDLTGDIVATSNVDTSAVGDYTVDYSVSDSAGNPATDSRSVVIVRRLLSCAGGGFEPPFDKVIVMNKNAKRVIVVKMVLVDENNPGFIADNIAPPLIDVSYDGAPSSGVPLTASDVLLAPSAATDGGEFIYEADKNLWRYNLGTRDYMYSGDYSVTAVSGDEDTYIIDASSCSGSFTRK